MIDASPSRRDKGFVTADAAGGLHLNYGTSGATLLKLSGGDGLRGVVFAPKADGIVTADERGRLAHWVVQQPASGGHVAALFGRSGTRATRGPSTSGSPPAAPTTSRRSSA